MLVPVFFLEDNQTNSSKRNLFGDGRRHDEFMSDEVPIELGLSCKVSVGVECAYVSRSLLGVTNMHIPISRTGMVFTYGHPLGTRSRMCESGMHRSRQEESKERSNWVLTKRVRKGGEEAKAIEVMLEFIRIFERRAYTRKTGSVTKQVNT